MKTKKKGGSLFILCHDAISEIVKYFDTKSFFNLTNTCKTARSFLMSDLCFGTKDLLFTKKRGTNPKQPINYVNQLRVFGIRDTFGKGIAEKFPKSRTLIAIIRFEYINHPTPQEIIGSKMRIGFRDLRNITLSRCRIKSTKCLSELKKLKTVNIHGSQGKFDTINVKAETMRFRDCVFKDDEDFVIECPKVKVLLFDSVEFNNNNNEYSSIDTQINVIDVFRKIRISKLDGLERISVRFGSFWFNNSCVHRRYSREIDLSDCKQLTEVELDFISTMKLVKLPLSINKLIIGNSNIKDIGKLEVYTNLKFLCLGNNNIEDITPIASLVNLKVLRLYDNKVKDISCLSNCKELEELTIDENPLNEDWDLTIVKLDKLKVLHIKCDAYESVYFAKWLFAACPSVNVVNYKSRWRL